MSERHWFLPDTPDVVGHLRGQLAIAIEGVEAFARWANGQDGAAAELEDATGRCRAAGRALFDELRTAFVIPVEPEDLFALSRGIARVLEGAGDTVREAEVMASSLDQGIADMAGHLGSALKHLDAAVAVMDGEGEAATTEADAAIAEIQDLDAAYAKGMAALLEVEPRSDRISRREIYRRVERLGETVVEVAERVIYAVVKQT